MSRPAPLMRRYRRWTGIALALATSILSCAPHRIEAPRIGLDVQRARFSSALAEREKRSAGVEAELSLWAYFSPADDLPGVQARLLLAGPDAFRLRVASAFGVALDLAGQDDSLTAYAPRERLGVEVGGESLGVRRPGSLGFRLWSATWRPPQQAWERAERADSLLRLRWKEGSDSVELEVGSSGLPASVTVGGPSGTVIARYRSWTSVEGVRWASLVEVEAEKGRWGLTGRVHRVRFVRPPERERLRVHIPGTAERLSAGELRQAFERLGRN